MPARGRVFSTPIKGVLGGYRLRPESCVGPSRTQSRRRRTPSARRALTTLRGRACPLLLVLRDAPAPRRFDRRRAAVGEANIGVRIGRDVAALDQPVQVLARLGEALRACIPTLSR